MSERKTDMAKQSKEELDHLIKEAGLDKEAAEKLHKANGTDASETPVPDTPRGHGAAAPHKPVLGNF